ncbi:MAG: ferritin family protein [Betaproteobacteria bacterium]|nr:ferritin family protein [Betaproteobacteria bacterium]MBI2959630.1 ferritin family protein [Betaproteobacteria bacterium]
MRQTATIHHLNGRKVHPASHLWHRETPKRRVGRRIDSPGSAYAHALAIAREAGTRYREFAAHMFDCGNEGLAELFSRLAEFEVEHAFRLAKKSVGVDIPLLAANEYAWLDSGAPVPEARAFVFRMMTPRLALEIALRAEERGKAFFERVCAESHRAEVRKLARELANGEASHIAWVKDALAHLPRPFQADEEQPGDPTIEQQM